MQALLMGLLALCNGTQGPTFWYLFREPLMAGFWVGLIYGDPVLGVTVGGTINVSYLGWISAGGANASDLYWAGLLGSFVVIKGGLAVDQSAAIAVPIGLLGNYVHVAYMTIASFWPNRFDALAEKGNWKAIRTLQVVGGPCIVLFLRALPVFLIANFGAEYIELLLNSLPVWAMQGLAVVGKIMPALGLSMLLKFLWKNDLAIFFVFGFSIAAYTGQTDLLFYAIIGICVALLLLKLGFMDEKEAR